MTPSDSGRALHNGRSTTESYALRSRHQEPEIDVYELDEDIIPDFDASLLRKHFGNNNDRHESLPRSDTPSVLFQHIISFMSRTRLLLRSSPAQGTGSSYGALPVDGLSFSTDAVEVDEEEIDDKRRRDRRKGKWSGLRQVETNTSSRSRRSGKSDSGSIPTRRSQHYQSMLDADSTFTTATTTPAADGGKLLESIIPDASSAESALKDIEDDDAAHTDSDDEGWSAEDAVDNSPSVKSNSRSALKTVFMVPVVKPFRMCHYLEVLHFCRSRIREFILTRGTHILYSLQYTRTLFAMIART